MYLKSIAVTIFVLLASLGTSLAFAHDGQDHSVVVAADTLPLGFESTGHEVSQIQTMLSKLGFLTVPPTGFYGPLTVAAVEQFQSNNNLVVSGIVTEQTHHVLQQQFANYSAKQSLYSTNLQSPVLQLLTSHTVKTPPIVLYASPSKVKKGETFTLIWSGINVTGCKAKGSWSGKQTSLGSKIITAKRIGTHKYTMVCKSGSRSVSKTVRVTVSRSDKQPTQLPKPDVSNNPTSPGESEGTTNTPTLPKPDVSNKPTSPGGDGGTTKPDTPTTNNPPASKNLTALIMGQSYAVNYSGFWSGRIRTMNPQINWYDERDPKTNLHKFNAAGAGIQKFESWEADVIAAKPDIVFISVLPSELQHPPSTKRYLDLAHRLNDVGIKVIMNTGWAHYAQPNDAAQKTAVAALKTSLASQNSRLSAIADTGSDPILGAKVSLYNPVIFKQDGTPHPEALARSGQPAAGHDFMLHYYSKALSEVAPGAVVYPYPTVTNAHRVDHSPTSPTPVPTPTPTPAPTPPNTQFPSIPSNFDINSELVPSWGTGGIAVSAAPDTVGAFRFICNPAHLGYNDPIVYPGQKGKSHLHQFFGNTLVDENSTYESLRKTGDSTCNNPLNRSAYWIPAMLDGVGNVVRPDYVSIYYKRLPKDSPECFKIAEKGCVGIPRGLQFVFGYDMAAGKAPTNGAGYFNCIGTGAVSGHYKDLDEARKHCPAGTQIGAVISAPTCWDGVNLDSPNHRSHMANATYGSWGYLKCPSTHPYVIPTFTLGAWYTSDTNLPTWHLSSDVMPNMTHTPGSTLHADWLGAWDDTVLKMWEDNCINKLLNCSGGDLGNGKQLKMFKNFSWLATPRVVPIPPKP